MERLGTVLVRQNRPQSFHGGWVSDYETRDMGKYDKETVSGKYYTMIDQSRQIFVNKGNSCKDFNTKMKTSDIGDYKNYASDSYGARDHFNYRFDGTYLTSDEAKALADYAKAKNMTIREFLTANGFDMKEMWFFSGIGEDVDSIESKRFLECVFANDCGVLKDGKLYMCPKPAKVDLVNKTFGTDFKVTEKDYIDIFKINDVDEILEFLAKPIPFCRYCSNWTMTEWGLSKRDKDEWLV